MSIKNPRDHGGGVDAAVQKYGGVRSDWIDLSTGINPVPYPVSKISDRAWATLPDQQAQQALVQAARRFWKIPRNLAVLPTNGASAPIAMIPRMHPAGTVRIDHPTYNEHAAAFQATGWQITKAATDAHVVVHPNNPTGNYFDGQMNARLNIIDESFCDVDPAKSRIADALRGDVLILKSFGKFWGLAGVRLGFVIGDPALVTPLQDALGPWPVSGPALQIATKALNDPDWAESTRGRLRNDSDRLDTLMQSSGAELLGGTTLFRLYDVDNAAAFQAKLARHHIWSRVFPWSETALRLGIPGPLDWGRFEGAL